ncbi:MAG: NTP transferase domain-containing protein [Spirochaetota bacterium]|nr:NTP transferase domain-containing protein [Spirochaetota bacterium]
MKIVLPLAGKGTRLLPHTTIVPKPLMFVAGQSILDHLMEELIALNPTEFVFVTGYMKEELETHLKNKYPNIAMKFLEQKDPQGLGHAIYQARDAFAKDEDMLVVLGDQTFTIDWTKMLQSSHNRISVVTVEDPSQFGIVSLDDRGFVTDMEEKPVNPKSNLAISGTYYFPSAQSVFSAIAYQIAQDIRTKGEIQITDSMRIMMDLGEQFEGLLIKDWNDCGNHKDLLAANKTLLQKNNTTSTTFDKSVIIYEPVWIHPSVKITNATIGPNVSLAENVIIDDSTLVNTIVDINTRIKNSRIIDSYLGRNMNIEKFSSSDEYLI